MADIFLSYSHDQKEVIRSFAYDLEAAGYTVWWDTSLVPGDIYRQVIDEQIENANIAIIVWTPESIKSLWVASEAEHALRLNKLFNVFHNCDPALLPKPFNQIHGVELSNRPAIFSALRRRGTTAKPSRQTRTQPALKPNAWPTRRLAAAAGSLAVLTAVLFGWPIIARMLPLSTGGTAKQAAEPTIATLEAAQRAADRIIADARKRADEADLRRLEAERDARLAEERRAKERADALDAADAKRRHAEVRPADPPNQTSSATSPSPTCSGRSVWSHNGSTLYLVADRDQRAFYYLEPREGMAAQNVSKGTLLFNGRRYGDRYEGTARNFSKNCGVRTYSVSGNVAGERKIVMTGQATRINQSTCSPLGTISDELEFDFVGCE